MVTHHHQDWDGQKKTEGKREEKQEMRREIKMIWGKEWRGGKDQDFWEHFTNQHTEKNLSDEIEGTSKFVCYRQISL